MASEKAERSLLRFLRSEAFSLKGGGIFSAVTRSGHAQDRAKPPPYNNLNNKIKPRGVRGLINHIVSSKAVILPTVAVLRVRQVRNRSV